jgi:L-arabinose isomerase
MEALRDLADMWGIELVVIDGATTVSAVADRLRWNQVYYRLNAGL